MIALAVIVFACGWIIWNTLWVWRMTGWSPRSWRWWVGTLDLWAISGGAGIIAYEAWRLGETRLTLGTWLLVIGLAGWAIANQFGIFNRKVEKIQ